MTFQREESTMKTAITTLTLVASMMLLGCGDDNGSMGTGGTAGMAGSAGMGGGTAGAGGGTAGAVPETPVVAVLQPYNAGGGDLFPAGSVEAHWYQSDGRYVVLYRGFDATDGTQICAGNSIELGANDFRSVSNSPYLGTVDEICNGAPNIASPPSGVFSCGSLLYYVTEIPTTFVGNLFGTLELGPPPPPPPPMNFVGQTSSVPSDIANTPEFTPGQTTYDLPPSGVDPGGVVTCGS